MPDRIGYAGLPFKPGIINSKIIGYHKKEHIKNTACIISPLLLYWERLKYPEAPEFRQIYTSVRDLPDVKQN